MDSGPIKVLIADDQAMVRYGLALIVDHEPGLAVVAQASTGREAIDAARLHRPDVALMDIRMPDLDGIAATKEICADATLAGTQVLVLTTFDDEEYVFGALRAGAAGFLLKDVEPQDLVDAIRRVNDGDSLLDPGVTRKVIETYLAAARPAVSSQAEASRKALQAEASPETDASRAGASETGASTGASETVSELGEPARREGSAAESGPGSMRSLTPPGTVAPGCPGDVAQRTGPCPDEDLALARLTGREGDVWRLVAEGLSNRQIGRQLGIAETTVKAHVTSLLVKLGVSSRVQAVILAYDVGLVAPAG